MAVAEMTRRSVHYEAALEDYLRSRGTPYIAVDESRRVIFSGAKIKSFDFLIYPPSGPSLIADVKGRKFPLQACVSVIQLGFDRPRDGNVHSDHSRRHGNERE